MEPRYDLGILLVHGIGQQVRGDTLVRFGEPLQQWLRRWISKRSTPGKVDRASIVEARFTPPVKDPEAPSRAELHIRSDPEGTAEPAKWLLAESWWASSFLPPSFRDLATWGFQILPLTLTTHFATRARRVLQDVGAARGLLRGAVALRLALEILAFMLALLLFPLIVALLMLVLIIGVLPIPRVRSLAARLQRILAGTLGDSFVLLASPIQEAVIVGKVERDFRWLVGQGCRHVAVVAHSQGAAIAHAAIRKLVKLRPELALGLLFITLGSGLNKLAEIREIRTPSKPRSVWTAPLGVLLLALTLPEVFSSGAENMIVLYVALAGLLLFGLGIKAAWEENRPEVGDLALGAGIRWIDFYASADPVPNGPIFDSEEATRRVMDARKVHNLGSALVDHVKYWQNEDDFVSQAVEALADHSRLKFSDDDSLDRSHLAVASSRRKWRVGWLSFARILIALLTSAVAVRYWSELRAMTEGPLNALVAILKLVPFVSDLVDPVIKWSGASEAVGAAALMGFGLIAYYGLYGVWLTWNSADIAALFKREPFEPYGTFLVFLFSLVFVVQLFALALAGLGQGIPAGLVAAVMFWFVAAVLLIFIVGFVGIAVGMLVQITTTLRDLLRSFIRLAQRFVGQQRIAAQSASGASSSRPLIKWREGQYSSRILTSLLVSILLTFPYATYVVAPMNSSELWVDHWFGQNGLLRAVEQQSSKFPIPQWQWLVGVLAVVLVTNVLGILGAFRGLHRRFARLAHAGPIVIAHANLLPEPQGIEVLMQGAAQVEAEYAAWESVLLELRAAETRATDGKAEITRIENGKTYVVASGSPLEKELARLLRQSARDAVAIAARLPDAAAAELLARISKTSPLAALALAERDPIPARQYLQPHAYETDWWLRTRIHGALARG